MSAMSLPSLQTPRLAWFAALVGLLLVAPSALGQILIDRRPGVPIRQGFEVREIRIEAKIVDQAAEVRLTQTFHNPTSMTLEAQYLFPVPENAAIRNLVLMVDGKELVGKLMPRDEARRVYEGIVRSKQDPALLEYTGRGLIQTSVFPIPPGADRTITLKYSTLLPRIFGAVDFTFPFGGRGFTSKPIGKLRIEVDLRTTNDLKTIHSPSHDVAIDRKGNRDAMVTFQRESFLPDQDFRLLFNEGEGALGAMVLSHPPTANEDGTLLLLASPTIETPPNKTPPAKTVVLILDRSGSMSGKKIEQARAAMKFVVENLNQDDLFNLILYDDTVEMFKPELLRCNAENRAEALRFIEGVRPGGSTDIDQGLRAGLKLIADESRPNYVIFLTDGLPTSGETNELKIAEAARAANPLKAKLFVFGVGYDVNARLLDRLSGENGGVSFYVKPDDNLEVAVSRFYERISTPALTDITVTFEGVEINRAMPRQLPDLFRGGQLVYVARYRKGGQARLILTGKVEGQINRYEFPIELAQEGSNVANSFVETLWATRRIGAILDQIDLKGKNDELINELVELSKRHGILTPYTSYLAEEEVSIQDRVALRSRATRNLEALNVTQGTFGVAQRRAKGTYLQADRVPAPVDLPPLAGIEVQSAATAGRIVGGERGALAVPPAARGGRDRTPGEVVRRLGGKTFFFKQGRWIDAEVTEEDLKATAKQKIIQRFDDNYFALADQLRGDQTAWLTLDGPITLKFAGRIYLIEASQENDAP